MTQRRVVTPTHERRDLVAGQRAGVLSFSVLASGLPAA
jgi:hypothetical protein